MLAPRPEPFPFEAVRDLVGILRAMYAVARRQGSGERRLATIRSVGDSLRQALDLAMEHAPGTLGHAAAWQRAEHATKALGDLADVTTPLEPMLEAAGDRVRRGAPDPAKRDAARRARRLRS